MRSDAGAAQDAGAAREIELDDPALLEKHEELLERDYILGLRAQIESLKTRVRLLRTRNKTLRARLESARSARRPTLISWVASKTRRRRA